MNGMTLGKRRFSFVFLFFFFDFAGDLFAQDARRGVSAARLGQQSAIFALQVKKKIIISIFSYIIIKFQLDNGRRGLYDCTGFYWVFPGDPSLRWMCLFEIRPFVDWNRRQTRFYWVLPGFTGFYWVLLGFTRFSWV